MNLTSGWFFLRGDIWHCLQTLLEKAMATHSSTVAWRIPWTEELDGLQSTGRKEPDTTERLHFHFQWLYNIQLKTSREVLFLPPSDAYVRSFLYLLYTLIKLYYTKALSNRASSLASDWILLQGPRILASWFNKNLSLVGVARSHQRADTLKP